MVTNNTQIATKNMNTPQAAIENNKENSQEESKEVDVQKMVEDSAVEVAISMGAQIILAMMEAQQTVKDNASGQKTVLDFLSGKEVSDDFNLANIGYDGKPITELSQDEAKALVEGDGFFSVNSTSDRVANFTISLAGDSLESLEKAREGLVQGFEEAEKLWGGKLPEISYETQARTLELVDARIAELKGETKADGSDDTTIEDGGVDIKV